MEQTSTRIRFWRHGVMRFASRGIRFVVVVYVGVVIVLWLLERRLVFQPDSAAQSWARAIESDTSDVTFPIDDGPMIHAWWLPPSNSAAGAFLIAHGNGGNLSHRGQLASDLRRATGAGVLMYDYPGYGKSGGKPTEAGCYAAGEAAYCWLRDEMTIPENRIVLLGESLGGGPAIELATRHDHRALVLMYTFTTLPAAAKFHFPWLPVATFMTTRFDNLSKIGQCHRPVFIFHGTADQVVPFGHGEALFAAANEPKQFLRLEGGGHDPVVGDRLFIPLAKFLTERATLE